MHLGQAPVPASVGFETLAKKISIVRGPPVGRDKDSQTNDEDGALLLPASKMVVSGGRRRRLRRLVDHLMGDGNANQDSLLERKAVRTLATRRNHYNALLAILAFSKQHCLPLTRDAKIDSCMVQYENHSFLQGVSNTITGDDTCSRGDRWQAFSRFGSRKSTAV